MIKSFKHKGLKNFYETGNTVGIDVYIVNYEDYH
jgi:plasmid maintenance system killer protein